MGKMLLPGAAACALLAIAGAAPAWAAFPGANGRLAAHVDTDRGPRVVSLRLDGRGWRRVGKIDASVPYAEEQSGRAKWSPSGRRVVYTNLVRGVEIRSASGRLLRRLTTTDRRDPAWAPSGKEIVTASYSEADRALVRMRLDGTVVRRLPLPQLYSAIVPEWSPDGRWIVFQEARPRSSRIWRMRPDGTGLEELGEGRNPTWSPDGRHIAFATWADVWVMRADGSGKREVVHSRVRDTDIRGVAWAPDGRRIAVSTFHYGFGIARPYRLLTVPAGGGRTTLHRRGGTMLQWIDWQPR